MHNLTFTTNSRLTIVLTSFGIFRDDNRNYINKNIQIMFLHVYLYTIMKVGYWR
ncbi:hypothetical protein VCHA43P282_20003 [Vibrio chagasii]|nr:hypothetical protein VCHA43P282_20003 [Vibrio chagasii]